MEKYKEKQNFRQWWIWIVFVGLLVAAVVDYTTQSTTSDSFGSYFGLTILFLMALLMWFTKLETKINEKGIYIRFFPFIIKWKQFYWENITKAYIREYKPIKEYGGWGIKGFSTRNVAYNISGNKGLQLEMKNGKKVLIGTKNQDKLLNYLKYLKSKYHIQAIVID